MTRRSFFKNLCLSVVAVSVPTDPFVSKIIKLEKRFKPGEFVYFSYGLNDPIKIMDTPEILAIPETIVWDNAPARIKIFKDIWMCAVKQLDKAKFEEHVTSMLDFCIALDSSFEAGIILLNTYSASHFWNAREHIAAVIIRSLNWKTFVEHHRGHAKNAESEDVKLHREYCSHPQNFKEYEFTEDEICQIDEIFKTPLHWMHQVLKEHGEIN